MWFLIPIALLVVIGASRKKPSAPVIPAKSVTQGELDRAAEWLMGKCRR